jgi:Phosphoesterase family
VPSSAVSEHPNADVTEGMQYVTAIVNAVMQSPIWQNTVIFLAWDDWGGFFDHAVPPVADLFNRARVGYGIRVPGIIISPWVKAGTIDHQTVSFDAYLKFIEDIFLSSQRIGGAAGLRPDSRPVVRESLTSIIQPTGTGFTGNPVPVGDLLNDFNFSQTPLNPLILPTNIPNNFKGTLKTNTSYAFPLNWQPPANVSVAGYTVYRTTTSGSNYTPVPGCSAAFGKPFTGTSCTDTTAQAGVTYYYVATSTDANGVESAHTGEQDITP